MLPVHDVIPTRSTPWVLLGLLATMAAAFVAELTVGPGTLEKIIYGFGLVPTQVSLATWYTPVTALFLHYGWLHAGVDLLALWIVGASVEDRLGHGRFLIFALATGAAGNAVETFARVGSPLPVVGSASLVTGLMAAHFLLFPKSRTLVLVPALPPNATEVPTLLVMGFWFLLQAIGSAGSVTEPLLTGGVTLFAPIGGAMAGLLLFWPLRSKARERVDWWGA